MKHGPKRMLKAEQEFFLVLVRLRLGLLGASRAGISTSNFSKANLTNPIRPSKACVQKTMPKCFKEIHSSVRVIRDCKEIFIEKPSSVKYPSQAYSNYKHHKTAIDLIGKSPSGAVSFCLTCMQVEHQTNS